MELRPYQTDALAAIRAKYAAGIRRVLLWLPTGAGKTVVFCQVLGGAAARGKRAIIVVAGVQLVEQASKRLFREGIDHGVMQADHWNRKPNSPVQVCSIDTLYARKVAPPADLVVIDEAHMAQRASYHWLASCYPDAFFLPVTATPHVRRGLRHVADDFVRPASIKSLTADGFLSKSRYIIPSSPDLDGAKIDSKTGDYQAQDLQERMAAVYGDVPGNYKERLAGAPAVLFAVSVEHSQAMTARLRDAGIRAEHVEAATSSTERNRVFRDLATGACQVVSNVGVLTTGWDLPELRGVIMCRPTKSYNLFVQMWGRGTRVLPDKNSFILLDHANNVREHGFVENEPELDLNGEPAKTSATNYPIICSECFGAFDPGEEGNKVCPYCGHDNAAQAVETRGGKRKDDEAPASMEEVDAEDELELAARDVKAWIKIARVRGYKPGWVWYRVKENYDEQTADVFKRKIDAEVPTPGARLTSE